MKHKMRIVINAPVVITFVALMFVVTLLGILTGGSSTKQLFSTYRSSLLSPLTYIRFFTHVLGHSGWSHFFRECDIHSASRSDAGREVRLHFTDQGDPDYGSSHSSGQFHFFPACRFVRGQRRGFCIYYPDVVYRIQ